MLLEESKRGEVFLDPNVKTLDALELMKRLNDAESYRVENALAELKRRGMSEVEISLAGRVFSPDPAVRKRLVADLPNVVGIDATEWLMLLCKDEDSDVRYSTFSFLATSNNPLLINKVKDLAQNDSDPRIRRQAELMGERRRK
jgi:hypothetical protein